MKVSVLLPYRNAAATLPEALDSVGAQRGVTIELVAVDDGSTDEGPAIVARYPGVVAIRTGGVGLARALAAGLKEASGEWVARMDADDVCLPERLAHQVAALVADLRLGAVGTRVAAFPAAEVGDGLLRYIAWQNGLTDAEAHARELFVESPLCHPSVMLRRAAVDEVGGWRDLPWPEDYDLWLRLDAAGWRLAKVPEVLLLWRHHAGRATFGDPRYALERFTEAKAPHLARRVRALGRPLVVWGAGPTGKRLARALEPYGARAAAFVDIDPRKIGGVARGVPIMPPERLAPGGQTVVVAVGARGARDLIRDRLLAVGFDEGRDFLCAA